MRVILFITLSLLFLSFSHSPKVKHLIGTWEIYMIQKKGKNPKELREKFLHFSKDGSIIGGVIGEEYSEKGTWVLDKTTNILTLETEDRDGERGDYLIIKLTKKEMVLRKDNYDIFLEKVAK
jgi:hypothetical protein